MRNKCAVKKTIVDLIILYFKYRNCYNSGFQKYSYFRNLMRYITDINDAIFLRRIFEDLINKKLIEKKLVIGSVRYRFNPCKKYEDPNRPIVINFL